MSPSIHELEAGAGRSLIAPNWRISRIGKDGEMVDHADIIHRTLGGKSQRRDIVMRRGRSAVSQGRQ